MAARLELVVERGSFSGPRARVACGEVDEARRARRRAADLNAARAVRRSSASPTSGRSTHCSGERSSRRRRARRRGGRPQRGTPSSVVSVTVARAVADGDRDLVEAEAVVAARRLRTAGSR